MHAEKSILGQCLSGCSITDCHNHPHGPASGWESPNSLPWSGVSLRQQDAGRSPQCRADGSAAGDDDSAGRGQEVRPGLVRLQHDEVALAVLVDQLQARALRQGLAVVLPQPGPQRPAAQPSSSAAAWEHATGPVPLCRLGAWTPHWHHPARLAAGMSAGGSAAETAWCSSRHALVSHL